jgi:hypothetical protein
MDVVTAEEARIAEEAGAVAVMALERVPADIRKNGGVARMSDPQVPGRRRGCGRQPMSSVAWLRSFFLLSRWQDGWVSGDERRWRLAGSATD